MKMAVEEGAAAAVMREWVQALVCAEAAAIGAASVRCSRSQAYAACDGVENRAALVLLLELCVVVSFLCLFFLELFDANAVLHPRPCIDVHWRVHRQCRHSTAGVPNRQCPFQQPVAASADVELDAQQLFAHRDHRCRGWGRGVERGVDLHPVGLRLCDRGPRVRAASELV